MTGTAALAALTGAGTGLGVLTVIAGTRATTAPPAARAWLTRSQMQRGGAGLAAGLLVLIITRWVAVALGVTALVIAYDRLFGGTRRARAALDRLDALAAWTESLRDMVASGVALPEALPAAAAAAAPAIRPALAGLTDRLSAREPLETALRALADDLDDGGADLVIAALLLNARAQGRSLEAVLSALATSIRSELRTRRTIDAERRSTRRAVQVVVTATVISALGLALGNPTYVAPYRTGTGQAVLAVVVTVFAAAFIWLARLAALPTTGRLLAPAQKSAR